MSGETEETTEVVATDLSAFTSIEEFDAHIAELADSPSVANLRLQTEAVAARAAYESAQADLAAALAEAEVIAAAEQVVAEVGSEDEVPADADVVEQVVEEQVDTELLAASVSSVSVVDPQPTGAEPVRSRRAQVRHHMGTTSEIVADAADLEKKFTAAFKGEGSTTELFSFPVWDRELVGEANVLKATNTPHENDRILGLVDNDGNRIEGLRDFRKANVHKAGVGGRVHRAECGGCSDCGNSFETPDCFAEFGEPLADCFDATPADACKFNVEKQVTLADADQQVYVYCAVDAEGKATSGILQPDGSVVPIDPKSPDTWKNVIPIETACGDKKGYSLEEFPLLFTVDRKTDMCDKPGTVTRTLNRYFAHQSRFMEARKKAILTDWANDNGFGITLAGPSGIGLEHDFSSLLSVLAAAIQAQAGVDSLEGAKLAVPGGMAAWAECASPGIINRLADKHGLAGLVECGGTGPYANAEKYTIGVDAEGVAAPKIALNVLAESLKTWQFVSFVPSQWRMPTGETTRIGVTDTFRDMDLAAQNKRGIVIYRDQTLFPVGCVPSSCYEATLCNVPTEPARSAIAGCEG